MTQDVRQWLDEIKRLKQQLAQTQRDLNANGDNAIILKPNNDVKKPGAI